MDQAPIFSSVKCTHMIFLVIAILDQVQEKVQTLPGADGMSVSNLAESFGDFLHKKKKIKQKRSKE